MEGERGCGHPHQLLWRVQCLLFDRGVFARKERAVVVGEELAHANSISGNTVGMLLLIIVVIPCHSQVFTRAITWIYNHQYSDWLLPGVLPAPYEKHASREHREEHTCCLECCQSDDPTTCSENRRIKPRTTIQIITNDDRHVSETKVHTALPRCRELRRVVPREGYTTVTRQNPVTYIM